MSSYILAEKATDENFDEEDYLAVNPDVAYAIKQGEIKSAREHFELFGKSEARNTRLPFSTILEPKRKKLERIKPLLRPELPYKMREDHLFDFLSEDMRTQFNIIESNMVSSNGYDGYVMGLINENENGLILDCGAGKRMEYFDNVVNFDIVDFDSTDVLGVGEDMPFVDNSFDAVISLSVLEHVKDPFQCSKEIARVLKPGGSLICSVPFLQPYHGYPSHYYNMTGQGLKNLFSDRLEIDKVDVYESVYPIWSLTWILRSWANGLQGQTKENFLQMKVADLIDSGEKYFDKAFVKELSPEKNMELASATVLFAHKKL